MATDVNHGAECAAGGICILGMVAEIEARMEPIRLGDGVPDRLLFRDDFCFPSRMIAAWCPRFASFVWTLTWVGRGVTNPRLAQTKGEPGTPTNSGRGTRGAGRRSL